QCQVSKPDLYEVVKPRNDLGPDNFCGAICSRKAGVGKVVCQTIHRHLLQVRQRISIVADDYPKIQHFRFKSAPVTFLAEGVCAVTAEEYADVHLVRARFHPIEESADSVPSTALPNFFSRQIRAEIAVDYPFLVGLRQIFVRAMNIDLPVQRAADQVFLTLAHLTGLKRLHYTVRDAFAFVRHGAIEVDADRAAESPAGWTCSERIVEREKSGRRRPYVDIAVGTMPAGGEPMFFHRAQPRDCQLSFSKFQRLFNRFHQTGLVQLINGDP